jgi:dipeptide/tripeptide permease
VVLGSILVLIGIPMLICPGSGLAVILAGLGMIGVGLRFKNAGR